MFKLGRRVENAKNVEWGFEELGVDTFRVLLVFEVQSSYFKKLLKKNAEEVFNQKPEELLKGIEQIKTFKFSEEILKLMKTALSPAFNDIAKELKQNKINVYNWIVTKDSKYTAFGEIHHAYIIIEGNYAKIN